MASVRMNRAIGGLSTQTWMVPRALTASVMTPALILEMSSFSPFALMACRVRKRQMLLVRTIRRRSTLIFMQPMPTMSCSILESWISGEASPNDAVSIASSDPDERLYNVVPSEHRRAAYLLRTNKISQGRCRIKRPEHHAGCELSQHARGGISVCRS